MPESQPSEVRVPCPECGHDTNDQSLLRATWSSRRSLIPAACLLVVLAAIAALSIPATRVWLTGYGAPYIGESSSEGYIVGTLPPSGITPADLRAIAEGYQSVDGLRSHLAEFADRQQHFDATLDQRSEITLSTVEPRGESDLHRTWGFPVSFVVQRENRTFDSMQELEQPVQDWIADPIDPDLMWIYFWQSTADQRNWQSTTVSNVTAFGVLTLVLLLSVATCRRLHTARARVTAVGVIMLAVASTGLVRSESPHLTYRNSSSPVLHGTGLNFDQLLGRSTSESSLRRLAASLYAALPDEDHADRIIVFGQRNPIHRNYHDTPIGLPYLSFGNFALTESHRPALDGSPDLARPVRFRSVPPVRVVNQSPMLAYAQGNRLYSFHAHTGNILSAAMLIALSWCIPAWTLAILAMRRHKRRLRVGQCVACGYHIPLRAPCN